MLNVLGCHERAPNEAIFKTYSLTHLVSSNYFYKWTNFNDWWELWIKYLFVNCYIYFPHLPKYIAWFQPMTRFVWWMYPWNVPQIIARYVVNSIHRFPYHLHCSCFITYVGKWVIMCILNKLQSQIYLTWRRTLELCFVSETGVVTTRHKSNKQRKYILDLLKVFWNVPPKQF